MPGAPVMRAALTLARDRSGSPMESKARLVFHHGGLPEPELNVAVHDREFGQWLAEPDFLWRRPRVVAEYDGDHHRTDGRQWRSDVARREGLEEDDWKVVILTSRDVLVHPDHMLNRLRRALAREGGPPPAHGR